MTPLPVGTASAGTCTRILNVMTLPGATIRPPCGSSTFPNSSNSCCVVPSAFFTIRVRFTEMDNALRGSGRLPPVSVSVASITCPGPAWAVEAWRVSLGCPTPNIPRSESKKPMVLAVWTAGLPAATSVVERTGRGFPPALQRVRNISTRAAASSREGRMEPPPARMFTTIGQPRARGSGLHSRTFSLLAACAVVFAVLLFRWELTSRPQLTVVEVSLGLHPPPVN